MLAGSALTMIEAVRNLHALGVPLERRDRRRDGRSRARARPAPTLGRLGVGLPADVVVLDDNLEIERVFVGGETRVVA